MMDGRMGGLLCKPIPHQTFHNMTPSLLADNLLFTFGRTNGSSPVSDELVFILVHDELIIKLLQKLARRGESSSSHCTQQFLLFSLQIQFKLSVALVQMHILKYI